MPVKVYDMGLVTELTAAIDDVVLESRIALEQRCLKQLQPSIFARIAFCARVLQDLAHSVQALLDAVMETGENLAQGPLVNI